MDNQTLIDDWIKNFGAGVTNQILDEHVYQWGNHMWHIFTWGKIQCLEGNAARNEFDKLTYLNAIKFQGGYAVEDYHIEIENVCEIEKTNSNELDNLGDVYIVDKNFKWTYVQTHEADLGPYYICITKPEK